MTKDIRMEMTYLQRYGHDRLIKRYSKVMYRKGYDYDGLMK